MNLEKLPCSVIVNKPLLTSYITACRIMVNMWLFYRQYGGKDCVTAVLYTRELGPVLIHIVYCLESYCSFITLCCNWRIDMLESVLQYGLSPTYYMKTNK